MSNKTKKAHESLFYVTKRDSIPTVKAWAIRIAAVGFALVVCGLLTMLLTGENPINVYASMIDGAIGTERRIWRLFQELAILLCVSLAVTPAFKMKFWNIGAEGQVLMGGLATAACMILFGNKLPTIALYPLIIVTSIAAGAIWAFIPAFFKAKWNTNETLFTLMMNYIAIQIVSYFTYIWSVPKGSGQIGVINASTKAGWLPAIGGSQYLINILIVAVLTFGMYIYLKYNKHGYELSVVGESENTARYVGINVKKVIMRTMLLSGAVCGIAGLLLVAGTDHSIAKETVDGRGFTAIMVSWLAKFNPLTMIITSFLIIFMERGAEQISSDFNVDPSISDILTGIILFFIIGCEFFLQYKIVFNKNRKGAN
mgnify:CR=1 FL=1